MKKGGCKKKAKSCAKPKRGGRAATNKKRQDEGTWLQISKIVLDFCFNICYNTTIVCLSIL